MKSPTAFRIETGWSPAEKKIARKAFDAALKRQCSAITARAKESWLPLRPRMASGNFTTIFPASGKRVDQRYDYRYSVLISVFAELLRDGWLAKADLDGLSADKIEQIEYWANPKG